MLDRSVEHQPTPHQGGVFGVDEEAHRHHFEFACAHGDDVRGDLPRIDRALEASFYTEKAWNRVAPNVGIEDTDTEALDRERRSEVGGNGTLADAALPAGDQHAAGCRGHRGIGRVLADVEARHLHHFGLLILGEFGPVDLDPFDTGQAQHAGSHVFLDLGAQRATRCGERNSDAGDSLIVDLGRLRHSELDDVRTELRIDHAAKHTEQVLGGGAIAHNVILRKVRLDFESKEADTLCITRFEWHWPIRRLCTPEGRST